MSFSIEEYIINAERIGRSSSFITETVKYAENLIGKGLPVIFSTHHLGEYIGVSYKDLIYLINNRSELYKFYEIKKRNGGLRQIVVPHLNLKLAQQYINSEILQKVPISSNACGFTKNKSILSNAVPHINKNAILNVDLLKFFDSISEQRVYGIFKSLGYAKNLAIDLARLVTVELPEDYYNKFSENHLQLYRALIPNGTAVLPQGASTSPALSNIILRRLDYRLTKLAAKHDISYSRYADDITFSGNKENLPKLDMLKCIIREEGFYINWDKVGIYRKGTKQTVTGLTVSNGVHIHRGFKKEIKKHIYCCKTFGVKQHLAFLELEDKGLYKEWLLGKIFFVKSIEKEVAEKMLTDFLKIEWPV
jgi:RNA-directed DNA polymerase